jgi:site-specific DNA-methyltransferase (adenine-specific)
MSGPIYQTNSASLWLGDCLEVMPALEAGGIDMVLCDLPYGTTQSPWDAVIPFAPLWEQFNRLCKGAIVLFAAQPFTSALVMSNPRAFRHEWIWEKNKASGHLNAKRRPMQAHESVLVFGDASFYRPQMTEGHRPGNKATRKDAEQRVYGAFKSTEYGGSTLRYPRSVQRFDIVNNDDPDKSHPNQKPTSWLEYLLRTYSDDGATVLDATMGSGSTGVACMNTGRRFVGIEKDPAYCAIAERRIRNALAPPDHGPLFADPSAAA